MDEPRGGLQSVCRIYFVKPPSTLFTFHYFSFPDGTDVGVFLVYQRAIVDFIQGVDVNGHGTHVASVNFITCSRILLTKCYQSGIAGGSRWGIAKVTESHICKE